MAKPKSRSAEESVASSSRGSHGTKKPSKKGKMASSASETKDAKQLKKLVAKLIEQKGDEGANNSAMVDKRICALSKKMMMKMAKNAKAENDEGELEETPKPSKTISAMKVERKKKVGKRGKGGPCADK